MNRELDKFLNIHIPSKGYHAHNGNIDLYTEKKLSFQCGCGENHPVNISFAVIDFPIENKAVYICPHTPYNTNIFTLVKATGILSVKGLKTIAFFKTTNENERQEIMRNLESRKKRN